MGQDFELKPAICVLNPDDVYNLKEKYPEESYYCLTPYDAIELKKAGVSFPEDTPLKEGLILTRDANRRGYYYRTNETDCRIINERCLALEAILSYLGGKEFRYAETTSFRGNHQVGVNVDANVKVPKVSLGVSNNTDVETDKDLGESEEKIVSAKWEGKYTREGYIRAHKLAEINGLLNDPKIASSFEQRTPSHPNPIETQEYHVNITADLDNNVRVLNELQGKLKNKVDVELKVNVETSRSMNQASTVDFFISFGPIPKEETRNVNTCEDISPIVRRRKKWLWPTIASVVIVTIATILFIVL